MKKGNFSLELNVVGGSTLNDCVDEAIEIAKKLGFSVRFKHNDIKFLISEDDTKEEVMKAYDKVQKAGKDLVATFFEKYEFDIIKSGY